MSVNVDRPPKPPGLTGDYARDMERMYKWMRDMARTSEQLYERTGAREDFVASAVETAEIASTTANASQAGAMIPTEGGSVTLTPADPLSYAVVNTTTARIDVAQHVRSDAGATLQAGSVSPNVTRGFSYYVYYADAADAGGAQTYLASTSLDTVTGTAGYRIIGTIFVATPPYLGGGGGGGGSLE